MDAALEQLLGAARQQTLAAFEQSVRDGERDPQAEAAEYGRRRRDYLTWLRMEEVPAEAAELAATLLDRHGLDPKPADRQQFQLALTRMLAELYAEFLQRAGSGTQGSR